MEKGDGAIPRDPPRRRSIAGLPVADGVVFLFAVVVLIFGSVKLGNCIDDDTYVYMLWGQDLLAGRHLNRFATTVPKILPTMVGIVAAMMPGEHGPEVFYTGVTIAVGALLAVLVARLARRLGGNLAYWLGPALLLCNVTYPLYVAMCQSTVYAAFFAVGAVLCATRAEPSVRNHVAAALWLLGAGLCRPEIGVLGGALAIVAWLRVGPRRLGAAVLIGGLALSSIALHLLFWRIAFGSFTYTTEVASEATVAMGWPVPDPWLGFAKQVARTIFYFGNRSWVLFLLAGFGGVVAVGARPRARISALLLFPSATVAFSWLLTARGIYFNVRPYHYVAMVLVVLAAGGAARLTEWAAASDDLLPKTSRAWRRLVAVLLVIGALAPAFAGRPWPTAARDRNLQIDAAAAYLREQLRGRESPPRIIIWQLALLAYRLGLPPDQHFRLAESAIASDQSTAPWDAEWYVVEGDCKPSPYERFIPEPTAWGARLVWRHPSGQMSIYRWDPDASADPGQGRQDAHER